MAVRWVRRRPLAPPTPVRGALIRGPVYAALAALAICSWWRHTGKLPLDNALLARSAFVSVTLVAATVWLGLLAFQETAARPGPRFMIRAVDLAFGNALFALLLFEGATQLLAHWYPSPIVWDQESVARKIEAVRWPPRHPYFDFRFNSRGYHDEEFFAAGPNDWVAAVLADSFGIGVVPYAFHYTRVAEQRLQSAWTGRYDRIALHNFGVAGIGMREYAYLLLTEALACRPRLVILCVFVGNDVFEFDLTRKKSCRWYLQGWLGGQVVKRLLAIGREMRARMLTNPAALGPDTGPLSDVPAYVHDWRLEEPRFSDDAFLKIERDRLEVCNPYNPAVTPFYDAFFESLSFFGNTLGDRLLVVLIPDEFQVNDELYDRLMRLVTQRQSYDRDYPQTRIRAFCEERGWAVLDLLPALREAQAKGRVYHLNDTHWNARGNRVAGEAIADYLLAR